MYTSFLKKGKTKRIHSESFRLCGLTTPLDGSEDMDIHAIKQLDIFDQLRQCKKKSTFDIEDDATSSEESIIQSVIEISDDRFQ